MSHHEAIYLEHKITIIQNRLDGPFIVQHEGTWWGLGMYMTSEDANEMRNAMIALYDQGRKHKAQEISTCLAE